MFLLNAELLSADASLVTMHGLLSATALSDQADSVDLFDQHHTCTSDLLFAGN